MINQVFKDQPALLMEFVQNHLIDYYKGSILTPADEDTWNVALDEVAKIQFVLQRGKPILGAMDPREAGWDVICPQRVLTTAIEFLERAQSLKNSDPDLAEIITETKALSVKLPHNMQVPRL
jgi:hypothetical protein